MQSHLLLRAFAVAVAEHYGEQTALDLLPQAAAFARAPVLAVLLVGVSLGFPMFLYMRELRLEQSRP